jgi:hypothetical protein
MILHPERYIKIEIKQPTQEMAVNRSKGRSMGR